MILVKIMNICIINKKISNKWKKVNIFTIYKKRNPNNPLNYRLIALLYTIYKIYSSLITKRLSDFMERKEAFSSILGSFRRDRSTFADS